MVSCPLTFSCLIVSMLSAAIGLMKNPTYRGTLMKFLLACAAPVLIIALSVAAADSADDQKMVAELDTQYQAAVKVNDAVTMDRILADDFVLVIGNGTVQTKADLLNEARSGRIIYERQDELEQKVRVWATQR
jgi:Domain of unknown function (DUF4440)